MTQARTTCLLTLTVLPCLITAPLAYPPPPGSQGQISSESIEVETGTPVGLDEASRVYFLGIEYYVAGETEMAAARFREALDLLESGIDAESPPADEQDLLRRKILYLLGKVTLNGENEIFWVDRDQVLGPPPETTGDLPDIRIVSDSETERWIRYFSEDARDRFTTYLERSGRYEAVMRTMLRSHGLPENLVYLPLIESGFNPKAYSVAHASGIWQFISSTGKRCGLRVDYWVDERRHPERSCEAAAIHLRHLWEMFESWPLVLASYNAGEKRVMDAILAGGTRDFSRLRLPRQTREYVPRYMAGALIAMNPEAYGFDVNYQSPLAYDVFEVDQATDLEYIARCCGTTEAALKDLNPHLRRGCTPPGEKGFAVMIPEETLELCQARFHGTPRHERLASQSQFTVHRVNRGETLSHIARRYGTTVSQIVSANSLRSKHLIHVGQKLTVPTPGGGYVAPYEAGTGDEGEKIVYVVKRGDTLDAIARAHRTKVDQIRRWNGLGRNQYIIHPGDRLLIFLSRRS